LHPDDIGAGGYGLIDHWRDHFGTAENIHPIARRAYHRTDDVHSPNMSARLTRSAAAMKISIARKSQGTADVAIDG
jgi:hypothetical protein